MTINKILRSRSLLIVIFFLISRSTMVLFEFTIHVDYGYMHFHDIELLRNSFWESILYTHAFTPWINILTGFVLLFPANLHIIIYQTLFYGMSLTALIIFGKFLYYLKLKKWTSLIIVSFFSLIPQYIYFEHFLSYTFPSMVLLLIVSDRLVIAIQKDDFKDWLIFFFWCIILCYVRTTFHYIWLIAVILGVGVVQKRISKRHVFAFSIPVFFLLLWYSKNLILFGFFGMSSWSGFNLSFTTVNTLSQEEKIILVQEEKLSSLALIPIYSGIGSYEEYIDLNNKKGIEVLDTKVKTQNKRNNFNHIGFIELSSLRMQDNLKFIKIYPLRYFKTVIKGLVQFFEPTTRWHPHDIKSSPHIPLREKIETWENVYNFTVHSLPIRRIGIYSILILFFLLSLLKYSHKVIKWQSFSLTEKMNAFFILNIFYVVSLSCLVTIGELSRYRFMIEPLLWLLTIHFLTTNKYTEMLKHKALQLLKSPQ